MSVLHSYNPKKITCALGRHIVTGFADDSMVSVEFAGDGTSYVQGADGEIVRTIDPSGVYTLKLTLQQTSATNTFLRQQYEKDREYGTGTFSVNVVDVWGEDKFVSPVAWVTKPASFQRGKQHSNSEWEITCADGEVKETGG